MEAGVTLVEACGHAARRRAEASIGFVLERQPGRRLASGVSFHHHTWRIFGQSIADRRTQHGHVLGV